MARYSAPGIQIGIHQFCINIDANNRGMSISTDSTKPHDMSGPTIYVAYKELDEFLLAVANAAQAQTGEQNILTAALSIAVHDEEVGPLVALSVLGAKLALDKREDEE